MCEPFEPQIKACSRKSSCSRQQVLRRLTRIVALLLADYKVRLTI